jgi:hypothetical protein
MVPLSPWMRWVLWVAGAYNLLSGLGMIVGYHEAHRMAGIPPPALPLPMQVLGLAIVLFGVGFFAVAAAPERNRVLLQLGLWFKLMAFVLSAIAVARGDITPKFLAVVFFADLIYVPPFWLILRRLGGHDQLRHAVAQPAESAWRDP